MDHSITNSSGTCPFRLTVRRRCTRVDKYSVQHALFLFRIIAQLNTFHAKCPQRDILPPEYELCDAVALTACRHGSVHNNPECDQTAMTDVNTEQRLQHQEWASIPEIKERYTLPHRTSLKRLHSNVRARQETRQGWEHVSSLLRSPLSSFHLELVSLRGNSSPRLLIITATIDRTLPWMTTDCEEHTAIWLRRQT